MGIIFNQQDNRSELQKRIAAELAEKAKKKNQPVDELPDGVKDSAYLEGTQHTGKYAWVWIAVVVVAAVVGVVYFVISSNQ